MFRPSTSAVNQCEQEPGRGFFGYLIRFAFLLGYFTLLPVLASLAVHWGAYLMTAHTFYEATWMPPILLLGGTFFGGVLIRQKIEDECGGMGLFALGIIALMLFSWMLYSDLQSLAGFYSRILPKPLEYRLLDFVFMLPGVGILGMLLYKYFAIKHYS